MTPSIIILSLLSSLFLFYLGLPWFALVPLIISMYIIFTNGDLHKKNTERQFSRYHILFGLRCTIVTGLSLLLHVFGVSLLIILCSLVGIHMLVIWGALWGKFIDEYIMFHIGYYFVMFVLLWYIPVTFGFHNGVTARLLFPVVTFLLYAGGTFFIEPFVKLPLARHYRTAVFFLVSFLSSIILYFFSAPLIGWTAALILYVGITWFLVYQLRSFMSHEKRKNVYAEDILAGKRVIQPPEGIWHSSQVFIARILQKLTYSLRLCVVWCSVALLTGAIVSAFLPNQAVGSTMTFIILLAGLIGYYYANTGWHALGYPTSGPDMLSGLFMHAVFAWILYTTTGSFNTTFIFIGMAWSIIHHGISVLLAKQARYRQSKRKYPLLYGYSISTAVCSIVIVMLFSYLDLDAIFIRAVNLLYLGIVGTMIYFFSRALSPQPQRASHTALDE